MSEKTENRLATILAIIIAVFMAVGVNAQTIVYNDTTFSSNNSFQNFINNKDVVFEGNVVVNDSKNHSPNACVVFKKTLTLKNNTKLTYNSTTKFYFIGDSNSLIVEAGSSVNYISTYPTYNFTGTTACNTSLPVEAIEFYYQDKGNGEGSFKLVVTDEYDIDKYRIVITDQDGIDIGYKWWYADETEKGLYRVYEIPVKLPTDCADIDFMYARVYKMEASTMEYEQILNTISILNQ